MLMYTAELKRPGEETTEVKKRVVGDLLRQLGLKHVAGEGGVSGARA